MAKITFLIDSPDNWMVPLTKDFINQLNQTHQVDLIFTEEEVSEGDILFILSFYKLVSSQTLAKNKRNIVIHASDLPKGKGWSPATWQIIEGKNEIPLTMFEAIDKVDAGPVFMKEVLQLDGTELINEWQNKMGKKILEMARKFIDEYPNNKSEPQTGEESFYERRKPEDSELDVDKTINEQFNLFRVVDNEKYPAFFKLKGRKYILKISED